MSKIFTADFFLRKLMTLLSAGKVVFAPRNRAKTWEFMLAVDLTMQDAFDILEQLQPRHYWKGPEDDKDGSAGDVMMFVFPYKKMTLYIKLKIWTDESGDHGAVLSFHEEGMHD